MQSKIIKKLKSFLSYSLKLFILTSFLISQSFIAEIFLYQNNPNTKVVNTAKANYSDHWYNTSYSYRKPITIHASQVSHTTEASQSNFPVLISLTNPDLKTTTHGGKVQNDPNGYDIIFVGQDGTTQTQLDHEMEKYDPTTGEIVAWVKIPTLSSVSDTTLYIYYGNSAINSSQEHKNAVWNDGIMGGGNFKGVWHMNQDPGGTDPQLKDSTANHNDVTTSGMTTSNLVTGRVGNAISFDGNLNYAYRNMVVPGNNGTVSMWIYSPAVGIGGSVFKSNANTRTYFAISSTSLIFTKGNPGVQIGNSIPKASTLGWHHYSLSWKNVSGSLFASSYFDGIGVTNGNDVSFLGNADGASMILGAFSTTGTENSVATDDELHLSDIARSADWIKTEYNNQSNPSTFYILGGEENTLPSALAEVVPVPTPSNNTTPSYTFSSTKAGTISYGPYCSSSTTSAVSGNNTIAFSALSIGAHSNCTIQVTDVFGVQSNVLTTTSFTIDDVPLASWYNSSWAYRRQVTIDHTKVPHTGSTTNLSNFPVFVSIANDANLRASSGKVKADGSDIIFTPQACASLEHCNPLNYEIESYDKDNGNLTAWVKIPTLYDASGSTNNILYMYYGNSNAVANTQLNVNSVWDSDFKGVWHLGDTPPGHAVGDYKDSTINTNNSTNAIDEPTATAGQLDGAQILNGTTSYIDVGNNSSLNIANNITVSAWVNLNSATGHNGIINKNGYQLYFLVSRSSHLIRFWLGGTSWTDYIVSYDGYDMPANSWHYVTAKYDNSTGIGKIYLDGNEVASNSKTAGNPVSSSHLEIGRLNPSNHFLNGSIDEVRISDTARSADWIKTEYNNQANSGTFLSLGLEENTLPPILMEVNPISTPTTNTTPSYTFSSTKSGTIAYAGDCSSSITSAVSGNNTITFNALSFSTHSNCRIQITDIFGVQSNILSVTGFTINTAITTYVVPAITDDLRILPESSISSSYLSDTVSAQISSGEYKAVSFVVKSNYNINALQVEASNLTGSGNTIPNSAVDIKSVKCWYRGDYGTTYVVKGRYLTPELLLKDDSLVNVDGDTGNQWNVSNPDGKNYLKLTDGSYIDISSATPQWSHADVVPISERPVQDAATLQPINLPANYNKQLWITLHMPDNTPAGNYSGTISLKDGAQTMKSLNVNIQVLPINLPQPNIEYSIYYYGQIIGNGSISSNDKTAQQYTAEQKDMREHGITNPNTFFADSNLLQQVSIRQQAGMDNTDFYNRSTSDTSKIPYYKNLLASYGVVNFWMYGPDEQDLNTPVNRAHINDVHNAGGKYFNSQTVSHADSVAYILDLAVVSGDLSPALAAKYHSYGHKVYSYANPQIVPNYPRLFRMNYGLALWQADYDGAMDYVYQGPFGDVWNDFDYVEGGKVYRDCVFALPTMDGVVDTIKWEGFREGVNDMRYLAVLQDAIATAKNHGGDSTATEAENYLANLKSSNLTNQDLDAIRSQIIDYILDLQSSSHSLVINRGTGSGSYTKDSHVNIMADTPQAGMVFNKWIGDTQYISNVNTVSTTVTMPSHSLSLTATYISSWYSNDYSYRKTIIIDHARVSNTNQSNFPVLISLIDPSFKNIANGGKVQNPNGYDIIFALPNGTPLNYEIESYDSTTGKLVTWVKIPLLSASVDTFLYMYYGDPNAVINTTSTVVWDNYFKGVWHLGDTPVGHAVGDYKDSTINANNSTNITNEPSIASGQISGAQGFNGTSNYVDAGNNSSLDIANNITVSAWVNLNSTTGHNGIINKNGYQLYFLVSRSSHIIRFWLGGTSWTDYIVSYEAYDMPISGWHYVTTKYDNSTGVGKIYLDGNEVASNSKTAGNPVSSSHLEIGRFNAGTHQFNGSLDEVRISSVARSADWIKTEYNNQSSPSTFSTLSFEETILPPTITSLSANLPNGTYGTGTTIPITINFSKDVTSTGNITLTLNTTPQRTCSFTVTNDNSATCNYTIQGGDSATNLNATISGTIHDQFNNLLTNFIPSSNLSDNTTINIKTSSSPFTPPTKPNITTIQSAANSGTTIDPQSIPSNITQIAISLTPDFKGVSWIDFDRKKFSTINQTTQTLYIKLRTNEGAVSDTIIITPQTIINNTISLIDGDIIQCKSSNDPNAVYIVKIIGTKTYIRHITSIQIFNYYKHLKWENLKQVDSLTPFSLSSWIRVNTGTNGLPKAEDKVYEINGDQTKHWINMTSNQFLSHGGFDEAIYTVNAGELNLYSAGADVVSL